MFQPIGCTLVESSEVGIKFHRWSADSEKYGGVDGTCHGLVFYNSYTESVHTYPTFVQRKDYSPFIVTTKDGASFKMDPTIAYQMNEEKACDIFVKYRKDLEDIEDGYMRTCIYDAYRISANKYTSDSLMANRAQFENDVRTLLEKNLSEEGFNVKEFTSQIDPPRSLVEMIDSKNRAIQSALKAENEVKEAEANAKIKIAQAKGDGEAMKIKADAEAYYNKTIAASLSDKIIAEDFIEKWDGHLPTVASGNGGMMMDISKFLK